MVAAEELRRERRGLARGQRVERLVDALEELARADLVGDAVGRVDLFVADLGDEVEGHEVTCGGRTVDRDECSEAAAETLELGVDVGLAGLDVVDRDLEAS